MRPLAVVVVFLLVLGLVPALFAFHAATRDARFPRKTMTPVGSRLPSPGGEFAAELETSKHIW